MDLVFFYDTTTVHWDIEDDDRERVWKRPPRDAFPFRLRGHCKDFRPDYPQVVIAMAVTRDGFLVRSWVLPGNTADVSTIAQVKRDLSAWNLRRCVVVGDRGNFLSRLCSAWDFGILPRPETVTGVLEPSWCEAVDACRLLTSPAYHLLRRLLRSLHAPRCDGLQGKPVRSKSLACRRLAGYR